MNCLPFLIHEGLLLCVFQETQIKHGIHIGHLVDNTQFLHLLCQISGMLDECFIDVTAAFNILGRNPHDLLGGTKLIGLFKPDVLVFLQVISSLHMGIDQRLYQFGIVLDGILGNGHTCIDGGNAVIEVGVAQHTAIAFQNSIRGVGFTGCCCGNCSHQGSSGHIQFTGQQSSLLVTRGGEGQNFQFIVFGNKLIVEIGQGYLPRGVPSTGIRAITPHTLVL